MNVLERKMTRYGTRFVVSDKGSSAELVVAEFVAVVGSWLSLGEYGPSLPITSHSASHTTPAARTAKKAHRQEKFIASQVTTGAEMVMPPNGPTFCRAVV